MILAMWYLADQDFWAKLLKNSWGIILWREDEVPNPQSDLHL